MIRKVLFISALTVYFVACIVLFARADDVKTYAYDDINRDKIVLYSMGYHPEVGNFMGYKVEDSVAWIVLIKQVEVMPTNSNNMNMISEIRYRFATEYELTLITLKGE